MRRVAILFAVVSLAGRSASADDALASARKSVESSDYMAARPLLVQALDAGVASPDELAEIYKLTGIVEAALGETKAAKRAFEDWLALDPKGTLPDGTSPKITKPFAAAQNANLQIKVKADTTSDPPSVAIAIVSDPLQLVASVRVFTRVDGAAETELDGKPGAAIALPHGHRLDLRVQALDSHGNRVVELGTTDVPLVITGAEPAPIAKRVVRPKPVEPDHPRPVLLRWWLWGTAAVAFAGAGTYFGFAARSNRDELATIDANSSEHPFSDAQKLQTKIDRELLAFDIGMGVGGAFAIGAAILYLTRPHYEQHVAIVPAPGGGTVVFGGAF
ncbi:MAG TPA: hypothetical protein VGG28_14870 [Kofleriaceae bacterium]